MTKINFYIMPLIRLATLAMRSLSKPMASYMKNKLKENQTFTNQMVKLGTQYQNLLNKLSREKKIISPERAIEVGSELVVEAGIFMFFGGIVIYDGYRSRQASERLHNRINILEEKLK